MDTKLKGRTALVLGASRGLGFAIAQGFAEEGARVALASRSLDRAREAASRIGHGTMAYACDTAKAAEVDALHADALAALGSIDILVLNSGGPPPGSAQGVTSDQWRASFEAMFVNLVRLADLALPAMRQARFGRILTVASSGVIQPIANLAISNAVRPALIGWGKTLATEVAGDGVTVNALIPGRIATDRIRELDEANAKRSGKTIDVVAAASKASIPAGRLGDPSEFAAAAVFLASEAGAYVTGSMMRIDGGAIASV